MLNIIKGKFTEFIIVVILFGGLFYAASTAWKNEEKLITVGEDVKSIKRSMISLLLEEKPNKSSIAKDLVSDADFIKGIKNFKNGKFQNAYTAWKASALNGNRDSVYAIAVANDALKIKLAKHILTDKEKENITEALKTSPKVNEKNGIYYLSTKIEGNSN